MFLFDSIFNGADLLFYIGALATVRVGYVIVKRKQEREEQE